MRRSTNAKGCVVNVRVKPLTKQRNPPIGLAVNHAEIIGEWGTGTWDRVPRTAKLYAPNILAVKARYIAGDLVANTFGRFGNGRLSSWNWTSPSVNPHKISNLRNVLALSPDESFAVLYDLVSWVREHGGSTGSLVGMARSTWRATLTREIVSRGDQPEYERISRGGRQSMNPHAPLEAHDVTLWDIRSAHAYTLGHLWLPTRWRNRVGTGDIPDEPTGFARALVYVPPFYFGPLPYHQTGRLAEYPRDDEFEGYWTYAELRAARDSGCNVHVIETWDGRGYTQPFLEWWKLLEEARNALDPRAMSALKLAANAFVGSFAATGYHGQHWMQNGRLRMSKPRGPLKPQCMAIQALVVGEVRARLYREVLWPYPEQVVSCHTDGVLVQGFVPLHDDGKAGSWRPKLRSQRVQVADPANYRYVTSDGEWSYIMAGIPVAKREDTFSRKWIRLENSPKALDRRNR